MKIPESYQVFTIKEVKKENYRINTLVLDKPLQQAQPGQFVMAWLPDVGEKPFSIANADPFSLTIAAVGPVSRALCALQPGERIWVRGPLGHGFQLEGQQHLLAAGGYGAAPLLFLAEQAIARGDEVCVCMGVRNEDELLLVEAFRRAGCEVRIATEDGSRGQQGLITGVIAEAIIDFKPDRLYACGPKPMLVALEKLCRIIRLPAQLSWEALMRCGIGICGSCEMDADVRDEVGIPAGWLTCQDGPVSHHTVS